MPTTGRVRQQQWDSRGDLDHHHIISFTNLVVQTVCFQSI
jgi:hypothetical protein